MTESSTTQDKQTEETSTVLLGTLKKWGLSRVVHSEIWYILKRWKNTIEVQLLNWEKSHLPS